MRVLHTVTAAEKIQLSLPVKPRVQVLRMEAQLCLLVLAVSLVLLNTNKI